MSNGNARGEVCDHGGGFPPYPRARIRFDEERQMKHYIVRRSKEMLAMLTAYKSGP